MIAGLDLSAFGGETGGTIAGRRTKRSDGRFCLNVTVENAEGTKRRVYFYGRTQAEAKAKLAAAASASAAANRSGTRPERCRTGSPNGERPPARQRPRRVDEDLDAGLTTRHVEPLIGHLALGQVKPSDITRVLLHMEKLGRASSTRRSAYAAFAVGL